MTEGNPLQRTAEWLRDRTGCLTASRFADVVARKRDGTPTKAYYDLQDVLIAERVLEKGRLHAAALRQGITHLYYLLQDLQKGVTPTESVWQSIEYGVDAVQAVEESATRDELHGAYLAVMERRMRVEAQAIKEAQACST